MNEPDNLVLEHLRAIRGKIDGLTEDTQEYRDGLGHLEAAVSSMSTRIDRMHRMIDTVFKRLELVD